ncbi:MAG: hypothetical protein RL440_1152 [Bacteroidota bacterium]|jgi:hypothetical protein
MKTIFFTLYCLAIALQLQAQFIQTESGQFEGQNIHQTDIDSLFISNPGLTWLEIHYVDSTLQLPALKALSIFSLHSATLRELTFTDSLPKLQLIDLTTPELRIFNEIPLPNLFQITLYASLDSLPNFICTAPELSLVDIKNYKDIMWPDCMEERFENGDFELSRCEIYPAIDSESRSSIATLDSNEEWNEDADDMNFEDTEEFQKEMKKSARRITIFKRSLGFVLAGIFFLIWVG